MNTPTDAECNGQAVAFDILQHDVKALDKIICNMADVVDMTDELEDAKKKTDQDDDLAYRMKMQRQVRAYKTLDTLIGEAVRQSTRIEGQLADFLETSPWQAETKQPSPAQLSPGQSRGFFFATALRNGCHNIRSCGQRIPVDTIEQAIGAVSPRLLHRWSGLA